MKRRELLVAGGALLATSLFPVGFARGADAKKKRVLYFTRSAGFEHSVVARKGDELSYTEKWFEQMAKKHGFDVHCTKDGKVFDGDLDQYDCIAFYTSGDLTQPAKKPQPGEPMSAEGKQRLLAAIAAGKGFYGLHAATDSFRGAGIDPYIAMVGGEFIGHNKPQEATMKLASAKFPGAPAEDKRLFEEWYAHKKLAKDLHVILVQETQGMEGPLYQRPPFPATWARMHEKGRVFYSSIGHMEKSFTTDWVEALLMGGLSWTFKNVDADVTPNMDKVTPGANEG